MKKAITLLLVIAIFVGCKKEENKIYLSAKVTPSITFNNSYKVGERINFHIVIEPDTQCQLEAVDIDLVAYKPDGSFVFLFSVPTIEFDPTNKKHTVYSSVDIKNKDENGAEIYSKGTIIYKLIYKSGCDNDSGIIKNLAEFDILPN